MSDKLKRAIAAANREHGKAITKADDAVSAARKALKHAVKAGEAILKAKENCQHGGFQTLFSANTLVDNLAEQGVKVSSLTCGGETFAMSYQQASKYLRAAKYPALAQESVEEAGRFRLNRARGVDQGRPAEAQQQAKAQTIF